MPEEIFYIQCDCKEGKLEKIVSTATSWGLNPGDEGDQTHFYVCNVCGGIYSRHESKPGFGDNSPSQFSDYRKYSGNLTKDEIKEHAPKHFGDLYSWDEADILTARAQNVTSDT